MKPSGWIGTLAIVLVLTLCGMVLSADESVPSLPELPRIVLTDLVIQPAAEHEGAYECSATIVDSRTGETLSAPRVLFLSGQEGKIRSGITLPDGQSAGLDIVVSANAEDRTAQVSIGLLQDGKDGGSTPVQTVRVSL